MAFIHPHLAQPQGHFFFTRDNVDDAEFFGNERESKRRRIEDLSQRYLKGGTLAIQTAKLRGPFQTTRRAREGPRQIRGIQQRVDGILRREHKVRHAEPSSPECTPEKTPSVVKEATREWLRRLEPLADSPEAAGDISRLEDRLDCLEDRTPSKPSHPPSIGKKPTVNHVLRRKNLKLCFKEKKKASQAHKTLASDSLLDLYNPDLSGKPAIRSNSQPTLACIPPYSQVIVDEDSVRRDPILIEDVDDIGDGTPRPAPTSEIAQVQPTSADILLSLQANVDEDSVCRHSEAGNEGCKIDSDQEGHLPGAPAPDFARETPGRAPLKSRTSAVVSSPVRKTVCIADGQENLPRNGKTPKELTTVRPQHSRTLSDPARQKEKTKKMHTLHASPTVFHSPFVYRKADEEKPKVATTKGTRRRADTARFVEFGSYPAPVDQAKQVEVIDEPQLPDSGVENIPIEKVPEDVPNDEVAKEEISKDEAPRNEALDYSAPEKEVPIESPIEEVRYGEIREEAPNEEAENAPESLPFDFSTQAAVITAQQAFQQQLVSPAKRSDIYDLLDPDPIFASQNTTPPPPGSPPSFSPITPFRFVNQEDCKLSEKPEAPQVSTQELFNAATPFAFSTVKKQKPRKSVTIGIPPLLNPNPNPAGIVSLLNPKDMSPTFTPVNGKLQSHIKSTSPTFAPVNEKPRNQSMSTSPPFTRVDKKPQSAPKLISPRWTPINSQAASPQWTPINAKREGDGDTTIADPTSMFDANEVITGTPAVSPSQRRKSRKLSSPLAARAVPPAPKTAPSALTSGLSSQPPPFTSPLTVHHLSQSQPQTQHITTPSPLLQRRCRSVSQSATMSALLSTSGTRPGRSTMLPKLPCAQRRSVALLGDDEDVDVDAVVEDADSFLSTWDWRKELGSVGA